MTLITDSMAGWMMRRDGYRRYAGADRIAANGDTANKIGTYCVAMLAGPMASRSTWRRRATTFDLSGSPTGRDPHRGARPARRGDLTVSADEMIARPEIEVYNPAFDVTPHRLIAAIITEKGILRPDFKESIGRLKIGKKKHTRR